MCTKPVHNKHKRSCHRVCVHCAIFYLFFSVVRESSLVVYSCTYGMQGWESIIVVIHLLHQTFSCTIVVTGFRQEEGRSCILGQSLLGIPSILFKLPGIWCNALQKRQVFWSLTWPVSVDGKWYPWKWFSENATPEVCDSNNVQAQQ